jgi:hypothetical protein
MRTSLNDIRQTENYLHRTLSPEESLLFEARLLSDPVLRLNVYVQQKVYSLLRLYHRKKTKEALEEVHQRIFHDPAKADLQQQIAQLFKHKGI